MVLTSATSGPTYKASPLSWPRTAVNSNVTGS
jgi:hypothetical protein